jgi:hypothetical protein
MEGSVRKKIPYRMFLKLLFMFLLIPLTFASVDSSGVSGKPRFIPESLTVYINWIMFFVMLGIFVYDNLDLIKSHQVDGYNLSTSHRYKLLAVTKFLFSTKTQKEIFEQNMADWDLEIYEAVKNRESDRLLMINLRNTYRFFLAIWLKSPIGDLIEFISKLAK